MDKHPGPFGANLTFGGPGTKPVKPGAMIRQVLSLMCSLSGPWNLAEKYPELRRIILEQTLEPLPPGMEIGMTFYLGPKVRISGPQLRIDSNEGSWRWVQEMAYPPFSFYLVIASNIDQPGLGLMVGDWTMLPPDSKQTFQGVYEIGFGWAPYPGDYRSRAAISGDSSN